MRYTVKLLALVAVLHVVASTFCPGDDDTNLIYLTDEFPNIENGAYEKENLFIIQPTILDATYVAAKTITIAGDGALLFEQGHPITIETNRIVVKDYGALLIGSEDRPHLDDVNIILKGDRTDRSQLGPEGEKSISVTDQGILQIVGKPKLAWTKLSQTAERFTKFTSSVIYHHATSDNAEKNTGRAGLMLYKFDPDTFKPTYFNVHKMEEKFVQQFIDELDNLEDGELVAIAMSNNFNTEYDVSSLFGAIETAAGIEENALLLRDAEPYDAFALVFKKGGFHHQVMDKMVGKEDASAMATIIYNEKKISAYSLVKYESSFRSSVDVRILDVDIGFPKIHVVHDISTWRFGDYVVLVSTDFADHGEVRRILDKPDKHTLMLSEELNYRHFGEVQDGVDMRGEVALLSRNIKIKGDMSYGCPKNNGNCKLYKYDTYGATIKIFESFGFVLIDSAELQNVGQLQDKGNYPIHFHMCKDIAGKTAIVRNNSIHDSYARCVTVHGTYGKSETELGVQVLGNVGYNIMGHCYFLEDGAEMATSLIGNLGAGIKRSNNGFKTDKNKPTVFWITNPKVIMKGNVAAGSEGFGIWYVFPDEPVGESKGLAYTYKEARRTPLWEFDNNVAHSCIKGGLNFDNILDNENGSVSGCMRYSPVQNPQNEKSPPAKAQFVRFTAYKNVEINCWLRGGWFEMIQFSSADSKKGLQFARGGSQQMFVKKSIFIGKSTNNYEEEGYPDAMSDSDLGQYFGVVFHDGPTYIQTSWFTGFKPCDDESCVAAALGFATKNKFTSSVVSNTTDIRFGFIDPSGGTRVYHGVVDETTTGGEGDFDGGETATFRDADGSVTRLESDTTWSYPAQVVTLEKYILTDQCSYRQNWDLAVCMSKYGKIYVKAWEIWPGGAETFDDLGAMKRINKSKKRDTAVENHESPSSEYMVILGDQQYYYNFQFTSEFPKSVLFEGRGVERNADVVVGICLPPGTTRDDMVLVYKSPNHVKTTNDDFLFVDTLEEVVSDQDMRRVFMDGRFLYVKFSSRKVRNADWEKHDTDHCPGEFCPRFMIFMNNQRDYKPCFKVKPKELTNPEKLLKKTPKMEGELGISSPDEDWGLSDTFGSVDGQWGEWSGWSKCCNNDCGEIETTTRIRLCDNPPPLGTGADCGGQDKESKDCEHPCPRNGAIIKWTSWSDCVCSGDAEGSKGAKFRDRGCDGTNYGGRYCSTGLNTAAPCDGKCDIESTGDPVAGTLTNWSTWTDCFCDGIAEGSTGVKTRTRSCEGAENGGKYCRGVLEEVKSCVGDCSFD